MQFVGNKGRFLKSQIKLQLPWNTVFFYNKLTCERRNFWNYGAFNLTTEKVCHIQSNYGNNFPRRVFFVRFTSKSTTMRNGFIYVFEEAECAPVTKFEALLRARDKFISY